MLIKLLKNSVNSFPKKTAIVYDKLRISYQELYTQIQGLSQGLKSLGIAQGDCVALVLPNCPEFVTSFYAIAQLNTIALPLNHLFKEEEISYCLDDSQAKVIITDIKRVEICRSAIAKLNRNIKIIVVDGFHPETYYFHDLILPVASAIDYNATSYFTGDLLYQYSSGSTGRPKRVCRTQLNLYHEVKNFTVTTQITSADNFLCTVPLYHSHGLGNCLLAATCNGATLVILEQVIQKNGTPIEVPFVFRRPRVLELIQSESISILPAVPYIFNTLAETPTDIQVDLSSLRLCFSAGNFLSQEVFDKFLQRFHLPVRQLYGCTEAGSIAINLGAELEETYNSVGFPMQNVEIKIVDDEGKEVPTGVIGEVVIKSQTLTCGYSNMPELNQQAFKDSCFFTGDLGKKDNFGRLYITGRKKLLIDTGGRKIDPIEIEDILLTHPKVKEVVVVGVKGHHAGEIVKAVIVQQGRDKCEDREILGYCKERLAEFKIPKIIEFRSEIPKSPLGKILRKELV
ncbi:MAG TPA: acyl--CoA ligase [Trichormus sp. M33_DOE_039]|nr:acyl--CoA ligase [Trichormus sp. M33_DOE_039]